ncbi:CLUMA_CG002438, isoform A [Clunio marinus]|uniref:CLUMA_CG002438, isoform A n=1 Tax=Clunio marinus TaxID=568069 RepID=A0A1J1HMD8_9DIPT|nr:CLUMA_CG002438, isoform A [Clunio marinus]
MADLKEIIALLDSNVSDLRILKEKARQVTKLFWFYWILCMIVAFCGCVIPWINYFQNPEPPYMVPVPTWSPFNHEQNIFGFVIVTIYETLAAAVYCGEHIAGDILPVYFFNVSSGLLQELNKRVTNIGKKRQRSMKSKKVKQDENFLELLKCIEIHSKVKSLLHEIENIFSIMVLIPFVVGGIIMCTTGFTLSKISMMEEPSSFIFMFTYLITTIMVIFLPCYFGNEVLLASQEFSTSLFHSDWIEENKNFKTAMKMVLENTKKPIEITVAQGVFPVNLLTFLRIINSAYSFYAVLQSIN